MPDHPNLWRATLQGTYQESAIIAGTAFCLSLILVLGRMDLWALLIPQSWKLLQPFEVNFSLQSLTVLRFHFEPLQNLVAQMLTRGELSFEAGSHPLAIGTKLKNILVIGACDVSVIIPTLNEEKYLPRCLQSLTRQSRKERFETIVVDGGSTDRTVEVAEKHADVVVVEPSPVGAARNIGAKHAKGEILAFIDADTVACERWIEEIAHMLKSHPGAVGVTGPTLPYEGTKLDRLAYHVATGWMQRFSLRLGRPHVAGFNCAYRKRPFWDAGGFDENRVLSEDVTLSLKMRHQGQIVFNTDMIAFTSLRRIKKYGYPFLTTYYAINAGMMVLFDRTLGYPPVR
jgi:hypothetical protein